MREGDKMSLTLIYPQPDTAGTDGRLDDVLVHALAGQPVRPVQRAEELDGLAGQKLLFALSLGDTGTNLEAVRMLSRLRREPQLLEGCTAGLLVDGAGPLYTKSAAAELTLAANLAGCSFVGRPLVEGPGTLTNFKIQAKILDTDLMGAYRAAARELVERLEGPPFTPKESPNLLVLHASSHHTSNTMALWAAAKARLGNRFTITEIGLRNGTLFDCSGCPYTMCLHFGEKGGCFYGGPMQEEVYPAVRRCDGVVMLCPNYNDALSANLTAFINRLTALFRQTRFYDKALFAIAVSGYSGGDILARQLIAAMNMNKSFYLPGRFAMLETANNPGEALATPGIEARLDNFAENIRNTLLKP
jgi:multimeric flavodoxin WrbA